MHHASQTIAISTRFHHPVASYPLGARTPYSGWKGALMMITNNLTRAAHAKQRTSLQSTVGHGSWSRPMMTTYITPATIPERQNVVGRLFPLQRAVVSIVSLLLAGHDGGSRPVSDRPFFPWKPFRLLRQWPALNQPRRRTLVRKKEIDAITRSIRCWFFLYFFLSFAFVKWRF